MNETTTNLEPPKAPDARRIRVLVPIAILLVAIVAFVAYRVSTGQLPASTEPTAVPISEQALEDSYGIRIKLLAVTAAGGLIDFRFEVLDKEKARTLLGDPNLALMVIADDSGTVVQAPPDTKQSFDLQDGMVYFVQFPNSRHAVESGAPVSLIIGDVRVENLVAK